MVFRIFFLLRKSDLRKPSQISALKLKCRLKRRHGRGKAYAKIHADADAVSRLKASPWEGGARDSRRVKGSLRTTSDGAYDFAWLQLLLFEFNHRPSHFAPICSSSVNAVRLLGGLCCKPGSGRSDFHANISIGMGRSASTEGKYTVPDFERTNALPLWRRG